MTGKLTLRPSPGIHPYDASGQSVLDISGGMDVSGGNARFLFDWSENIIDLSTIRTQIRMSTWSDGVEKPEIKLNIKQQNPMIDMIGGIETGTSDDWPKDGK